MILAVEEVLSELVLRKAIKKFRPDIEIANAIGHSGKTYLQGKARELNRTAQSYPVFVLADLDNTEPCPPQTITNWLGSSPQTFMLLRLAVMEVESWIMADREEFAGFMGVRIGKIPLNPDQIQKPKEFVVSLARSSRKKDVRKDFVPSPRSTALVGPAYNLRLSNFVSEFWDPEKAMQVSPSLNKAIVRLRDLRIPGQV